MAVIEKDLGPVSAYAVAVAHGYTGTEAEWEALIANSAINAQSADASATAAAASAQEATQQKTQAQAQAAAAQAHALDASRYAQNAGQANSYAQMASSNAAVSAANASNAQTAAEAAQAAAEAAVTGAEAAQAAAEAAVTDAQTAKTAAETAAATAAAAYGTDLLADDYSTSKTYAVGDYVIYSGNLYRCTTAITTAEAWTAAHWTRAQVGPDLDDLKSAITQQTRNLIAGVVFSKSIESNGTYWNSNTTDVYYAPVEEGKSYYVTVDDASGLVCAFYTSAPVTSGQSYNSSRTIQSNRVIVAPITGYIGFRANKNTTPQIEEGTQPTEYIRPVSAVDAIVREQAAENTDKITSVTDVVSEITARGNVFDSANVVEGYWVGGSAGSTVTFVADSNACYFTLPVIGKNGALIISLVNFPSWTLGDNVGRLARNTDNKIYAAVYGHRTPIDTITFTGSWTETNTDIVLYINCTISDKDKMAVYINDAITQYTPYNGAALSVKNSPLYGKKMCCNGDSIMYGAGATGGFASILAAKYGMTLQNIAVSGGTIASGTTDSGTNRHWIAATMSNLANDGDYYIIEGGLNDYSLNVPLFTSGETDVRNNILTTQPSDLAMFSEAMESLCYDLVVNHTEKKKGFIFPHKISWMDWTTNSLGITYLEYKDTQKKILKKWGIQFLDLSEISGMDTVFNAISAAYTSNNDRTHPNANGYLKFYVPHIERFMESL